MGDLVITEEFKEAFRIIEDTDDSLFVSGKAGTGKSTFLKFLSDHCSKAYVILSPTGLAALNVGGQTIHSFFRFPATLLYEDDIKVLNEEKRNVMSKIDLFIIDEVSMLRCDVLDAIDTSLRKNLKSPLPFAGKQLLFLGDLFQLPPVVKKEEESYFKGTYDSPYFFDAMVMKEFEVEYLEFSKIFRQSDIRFIEALNRIRIGEHTQSDLDFFNRQHDPNIDWKEDNIPILVPYNSQAETINTVGLKRLTSESKFFEGKINGDFPNYSVPVPLRLELKVGAQIMITVNDSEQRYSNGTVGKIKEIQDDCLIIGIRGEYGEFEIFLTRNVWKWTERKYSNITQKMENQIMGTYEQFPVRLSWAISIHKSQGMSFNNVIIDLGNGAFGNGQVYVALSRSRSLEGITLVRPIFEKDIIVDYGLADYFNTLG